MTNEKDAGNPRSDETNQRKNKNFLALMLKRECQDPITCRLRLSKWVARIASAVCLKLQQDLVKNKRVAMNMWLANVDRANRAAKEYYKVHLPKEAVNWSSASPLDIEGALLEVIAPIPDNHLWYELRIYAASFRPEPCHSADYSHTGSTTSEDSLDPYMPTSTSRDQNRPVMTPVTNDQETNNNQTEPTDPVMAAEIDAMLDMQSEPNSPSKIPETNVDDWVMSIDQIQQSLLETSNDEESSSSSTSSSTDTDDTPLNFVEKRVVAPEPKPDLAPSELQIPGDTNDDSDSDIEIIGSFPGWVAQHKR